LQVAWQDKQTPQLQNQGWTINGGGGVSLKSTMNVLGGWVSYNVNFTNVPTGINANFYTITPKFAGPVYNANADYCDGNNAKWCVEADYIESNGFCGGASALHTVPGTGPSNNCNGWGCSTSYKYNGANFSMRVSFDTQGRWTVVRNGQTLPQLSPVPQPLDWDNLAKATRDQGQLMYSTQWKGWVPVEDCGTNGNLDAARMSVSNLQICGTKVQGPNINTCGTC